MMRNIDGSELHELFTTEDGSWQLLRVDMPGIQVQSLRAFHAGCDGKVEFNMDPFSDCSWFLDEEATCWTCGRPVPQEIQTLFVLHEYGAGNLDKYDEPEDRDL